jgi:hypothetical protein
MRQTPNMSPQVARSLYWLPGPSLAIALVAFAVLGRVGPGLLAFCFVAGLAFMLAAPLMQLVLLATPWFKGSYGKACAVALATVLAAMAVPLLGGVFSFW